MEAIRVAMFAERLAPELADADQTLATELTGLPPATYGKLAKAKLDAVDQRKAIRAVLMLDG